MITEQSLADVVAEISSAGEAKMQETVRAFLRTQPAIGQYVAASEKDLGMQGAGLVLLHAAVIARAAEQTFSRRLARVELPVLREASIKARQVAAFGEAQPAVAEYLLANVATDGSFVDAKRREIGLGLLRIIVLGIRAQIQLAGRFTTKPPGPRQP